MLDLYKLTFENGSQKEEGNFLNLLQKEGSTQKGGGVLSENGGSNPGGNYGCNLYTFFPFKRFLKLFLYKLYIRKCSTTSFTVVELHLLCQKGHVPFEIPCFKRY